MAEDCFEISIRNLGGFVARTGCFAVSEYSLYLNCISPQYQEKEKVVYLTMNTSYEDL